MAKKPVIFLAFANEQEDQDRYLRGLAREQAKIREAIEPAVVAGLCELIVETHTTVDSILSTFQKSRYKDRIAIFHYGGHADGYQLLLESLEGSNVVAHGAGLVSFLGGQSSLKLVFLNGCCTQQQAIDLNQAGVPAVIGTSHAISDQVATDLASRFYSGLGQGASVRRAWKEAEDEVKITKGSRLVRSLDFEEAEAPQTDFFPWDLYVRNGSERIETWNLPDAGENPLFGLPELPFHHLPDHPFRFLERYSHKEAAIFFGRSYYIRDLFDRATSHTSAPVILFYGQSGVGKSSLLDAGLLPRLQQVCEVAYLRRDRLLGLSGTLRSAFSQFGGNVFDESSLSNYFQQKANRKEQQQLNRQIAQIESLVESLPEADQDELLRAVQSLKSQKNLNGQNDLGESGESTGPFQLKDAWMRVEAASKKPLVIVMDQVEEVFTQTREEEAHELKEFLTLVQELFENTHQMPRGKIILSYRKEYHPEINEACKNLLISRESVFLQHLKRKDIKEVVMGLAKDERLRKSYRLEIEPELPLIIADDLLEDKDSPIAPVLQILLTKMWRMTEEAEQRVFSVESYQNLRREGILMDDFLHQQMAAIQQWQPEMVNTGLALDLLHFHTTALGTAAARERQIILERYGHEQAEVAALIEKCKTLYLLAEGGQGQTVLAHDTLAPLIQNDFKHSDLPGQRAMRILETKMHEFENDPATSMDTVDLEIVESGQNGMPNWNESQLKLIENSRRRRRRKKIQRKIIGIAIAFATIAVLGFAIYAGNQRNKAQKNMVDAQNSQQEAEEQALLARQKTKEAQDSARVAREQRLLAELKGKEAQDSAEVARIQREIARLNEQAARDSARVAQEQRRIAEQKEKEAQDSTLVAIQQRNIANEATTAANERFYLSKALSLANKSLFVEDSMQKALLAMQAFSFNQAHKGPDYHPDLYRAMYESLAALRGENYHLFNAHRDAIKAMINIPDGTLLSIGADGKSLRWDEAPGLRIVSTGILPNTIPRSYALNKQGNVIVTGFGNLVQLNPYSLKSTMIPHPGWIWSVVDLPGSEEFVVVNDQKELMLLKDEELEVIQKLVRPVKSLLLHPREKVVIGAETGGKIWMWDYTKDFAGKLYLDMGLEWPGLQIQSMEISQNGYYLAIGDIEGRIFILDWQKKSLINPPLTGHFAQITDLAFHPNGQQLASASWDHTVRLWNLQQLGELPIVLDDHPSWVMSLVYRQSGDVLLAGLKNGRLKYWYTQPALMEAELKKKLSRPLSETEWHRYVGDEIPYSECVIPE